MDNRRLSGFIFLILLFIVGVVAGYVYFVKVFYKGSHALKNAETSNITEDFFSLRIYYPSGDGLQMEEKRLPRRTAQIAIAEATVEEFLKGPSSGITSGISKNVKLLGIYKDIDGIFYVDLSDEFRRNFQGDAFAEILLLKGLYKSLISNMDDIQDLKVLIEGNEIETLGGHFYLLYPLKDMVSPEFY
ncbi:MAG: hypothetical protein A2Y97_09900 [Nitrospirae bacterium RBG_13_39_12]|nr:MAG: hypothetical protein A2Y97_09900 [Nitrospirae bacterium RBG_13_39_12]